MYSSEASDISAMIPLSAKMKLINLHQKFGLFVNCSKLTYRTLTIKGGGSIRFRAVVFDAGMALTGRMASGTTRTGTA